MSLDSEYPYTYQLQLVKTKTSTWVLFFALFGGLILAMVLTFNVSLYFNISANIFVSLFFIGGFLFLFIKYAHLLMIKYSSSISFFDSHFEVGEVSYNWNDVEWFANNRGGKFSIGLVIGLKGRSQEVQVFVASKSGKNLDECVKLMETFKTIIDQKSIKTRNYYNTPKWRMVANSLLLSNLIPLSLFAVTAIEIKYTVSILFGWIFISLPASLIIYFNQD